MTKWRLLNQKEKLEWLVNQNILPTAGAEALIDEPHNLQELLNAFSENVIGKLPLPFSVIPNVKINDQNHHIPFSIEETSVVAALNHCNKLLKAHGTLTAEADESQIQAQIYIPAHAPFQKDRFEEKRQQLMQRLNDTVAKKMTNRGGGVSSITIDRQMDGHTLLLIQMNPKDAHGANFACQVAHMLRQLLLEQEITTLCYSILTNVSTAMSSATLTLCNQSSEFIRAMLDMSTFAQISPLRAATHNKGILNGMDGILLATGNDWRANSAGLYHHAHLTGSHQPLSTWSSPEPGVLQGKLVAPVQLGTTGGVTRAHPICQTALDILQRPNKQQLCAITAAIGLMQNFSAMRAIALHQLVKGHLSLHIQNRLIHSGQSINAQQISRLKTTLDQKGYLSSEDIENREANTHPHTE